MFLRTRHPVWIFLCVASLALVFSLPLTAQQVVGPLVFSDVHHDVSPAVRDMPTITGPGNSATAHVKRENAPGRPTALPPGMGGLQQAGLRDAAVHASAVPSPVGLAPTLNLG